MTSLSLEENEQLCCTPLRNYAPIHRHIMMNTVKQKMKRQKRVVVGQELVDVEQETMHPIFQNCPYEIPQEEAWKRFSECV